MDSRTTFGRGLAALRKARGLTQAELAEKLDVSLQFLASIEQGKKAPSFDTLDALSAVLAVTPGAIFEAGTSEQNSPRGPSAALTRAISSLPAGADEPLLTIVGAVSRLLVPKAESRARKPSGAARTNRPAARRPKGR